MELCQVYCVVIGWFFGSTKPLARGGYFFRDMRVSGKQVGIVGVDTNIQDDVRVSAAEKMNAGQGGDDVTQRILADV